MKTQQQILDKIKECEKRIDKFLVDNDPLTDAGVIVLETGIEAKKALLWVLSDNGLLPAGGDDFEKKVRWEITCYEAGKVF